MNRRINFTQLKGLFFTKGLLAILLAAPGVATAAGTGTATLDDIKDTNYPVPSGAYFVSPDGKDTNTGRSYNSPWSVTKATKSAPAGSTIVFKGGTYRNVSSGINKKLTLQAYPHEKPLLKGSIEVTGWAVDGRTWRKDGWNYSFPQTVGSQYIDPSYPMAGRGDMVYIDGIALKQVASKAQVVPGAFYVDYANKKLYIGNNPAGKTVEATALPEAIKMWKSGSSNPSGTVIRGLGFAHYATKPLDVGAPNVTVENNTFVWNGEMGARFAGASDGIVRGNIFSYNGRRGLGGSGDRILLQANTISYNNVERFAKTWDAAGAKFIWSDGITIRNNIVENNFANGIWLDESIINATVVNNTVRNNELMGIFYELSHKAILAANIVYKNAVGIMISDSSSVRVYNNTLSMNNTNIIVKDSPRRNIKAKEVAEGITWITRNNVFKNNILSSATGSSIFNASDCSTYQLATSMISDTSYNAYYRKSSSDPKSAAKWSWGRGKCSVAYSSIAAFKSATGLEQQTLAFDNVATNPFFVDEAKGDFRLKQGSSAIGRGQALPSDIAKAMGVTSGVSVDLGAVQSKAVLVQ